MDTPPDQPSRAKQLIVQAEALAWLAEHPAAANSSVITSLPDVSELPELGFEAWRSWFSNAARAVIRWLPSSGVAIFYQSDIRHAGLWIDKGYLVMRAAEEERAHLLWHKIVCRLPAGTTGLGRSSYSHMLCFARDAPAPARVPSPDVLAEAGAMSWSRAMGSAACELACRYLRDETPTRVVVDPFCGRGNVLAVASTLGFDVIGVDLSAKRCRAARSLIANAIPQGDAFARGARLFNAGEFFDAHEAWEDRWRAAPEASERRFLQGLIQVAAGFHKLLEMHDSAAALRLLAKGLAKLNACPAQVGDLDLAKFRDAIDRCARSLANGQLERSAIPRVDVDDSEAR
jgi:predicted metal-dependent hydrolase